MKHSANTFMITLGRMVNLLAWVAIIGLSLLFFAENVLVYLTGFRSPNFERHPLWISLHLSGGTLLLLLGPIQFWPRIRMRFPHIHRLLGKLYLAGGFVGGLAALRLSLSSPCVSCRISLSILSILLLFFTFGAWWAIRKKRVEVHRQFMVRSYTCVLAFVGVRISDLVSLDFLFGDLPDPVFARTVNEYFFSFVPLLLGEFFLTWWPALKGGRK